MNDLIQFHWAENELPGVNSISYADGTIVMLNCYRTEAGLPYAFPLCETTVESLVRFNDDIWTEVQIFVRTTDEKSGLNYVAGEGGMGNEGFIACTNTSNNLIWAVFFENSNPFERLEVRDGKLYAVSTYNEKYCMELTSPIEISIQLVK